MESPRLFKRNNGFTAGQWQSRSLLGWRMWTGYAAMHVVSMPRWEGHSWSLTAVIYSASPARKRVWVPVFV